MTTYVALLRGINVGGNNSIKMLDLKACFETMGFTNVRTYIQSGNVVFVSPEQDIAKLTAKVEAALSKTFNYKSRVVLRSHEQLQAVVAQAPKHFGDKPAEYRYDVIFLKEPFTVAEAIKGISAKEGVDQVFAGEGVVYFSRLISKATQSHLAKIVGTPMYQNMTIRNWNTVNKLHALMN
jgi:uncharacterized protein (DUF1697 family)